MTYKYQKNDSRTSDFIWILGVVLQIFWPFHKINFGHFIKLLYLYNLFVVIMPIGREYIHMDLCLKDTIHQTVFLGNLATPAVFRLSLQWFWMACTCLRVVCNLVEQFDGFLIRCWFAAFQFGQTLSCFRSKSNKLTWGQSLCEVCFLKANDLIQS